MQTTNIKKFTVAIFEDGMYQGSYEWKGGVPISVGEFMTVEVSGVGEVYEMYNSEFKMTAEIYNEMDQRVDVIYYFRLKVDG